MNNVQWKNEVVFNDRCIVCFLDIPDHGMNKYRLFCGIPCAQMMRDFRKENGLWELPLRRYGRYAKVHKKEVYRY